MSPEALMVSHFCAAIFCGWCADVAKAKGGMPIRYRLCVFFAFANFFLGVMATSL